MQIHELLPKVAADIGVVGKNKRNAQQGYNFRSIDDVMDACHGALTKNGVTVVPEVISSTRETKETKNGGTMMSTIITMKYSFVAPDGSSVSAIVIGEGMDSGDKSANKAMSAAYKYAAGQVFAIPFNLDDSENDSPEIGKKKPIQPPKVEPKIDAPAPNPPEPPKVPPAPSNAEKPETGKDVADKNKKLRELAIKNGAKSQNEIRELIGGVIGHEIKSALELSAEERESAIQALEKELVLKESTKEAA